MSVVLFKLGIALCLTGMGWSIDKFYPYFYRCNTVKRVPVLLIAFVLLRILPFVLVYIVAAQSAQSDVTLFWDWASHASQGQVVYRDFENDYAPAFPYILALSLWVWRDARSIVFLMILIEFGVLVLTRRIYLRSDEIDQSSINRASFLYLMSPAPLVFTVLGGQEDVWLWGIGALVAGFMLNKKEAQAGIIMGFGLLTSKAFLIFAAASTFWAARRPLSYFLGLSIPISICYGMLWFVVGEKLLMPFRQASAPSPPNIWFLLNALSNGQVPLASPLLSLGSLMVVAFLSCVFFRTYCEKLNNSVLGYSKGWVVIYALLMLLSPKSFGNYVQMFLMPLFFISFSQKRTENPLIVLTGLLSIVACVQPSLWFSLGQPMYNSWSSLTSLAIVVEIAAEMSIVVLLCLIIRHVWQTEMRVAKV